MAPFIVRNNWLARGLADSLAFWTVSDIFEENRLGDAPFHGGFGLVNAQSLKKAAYHGYRLLSRLGSRELASGENYAATVRDDGPSPCCCGTTGTTGAGRHARSYNTTGLWAGRTLARSTSCSSPGARSTSGYGSQE